MAGTGARPPRRGRRNHPEYDLQVAAVEWMKQNYPHVRVQAGAAGAHYSGSVFSRVLQGLRLRKAGLSAGFPDLFVISPDAAGASARPCSQPSPCARPCFRPCFRPPARNPPTLVL